MPSFLTRMHCASEASICADAISRTLMNMPQMPCSSNVRVRAYTGHERHPMQTESTLSMTRTQWPYPATAAGFSHEDTPVFEL